MKQISAALQAHLAGDVTTLAVCWRVERRDGVLILGTEHDADIEVPVGDSPANALAGVYVAQAGITGSNVRSTSDMSADNMEITGAINAGDLQLVDLSAADIEAGLFDDASVVLFMVDWTAPESGQIILRTGNIGEISRTAEGQYRSELRGLVQKLTRNIVRTYGANCDAELGDARCGVNLAALTVPGVVTAVISAREFSATLTDSPGGDYDITLFLPMPATIAVGDEFTIQPGCDKSVPTCKVVFDNLVNFRGHGFWVPGAGDLAMFGGQTAARAADDDANAFEQLIANWFTLHPFGPELEPGSPQSGGYYNGGMITWTTGENATFSMEVKLASVNSP